eukprot:GHVT01096478.1.p1 GENE.GHVT01096478.1~~GHVT01096478.1.p1  ORF type:complete len:143 (-),score=15.38 GHVT01096478.1:44-472(-)
MTCSARISFVNWATNQAEGVESMPRGSRPVVGRGHPHCIQLFGVVESHEANASQRLAVGMKPMALRMWTCGLAKSCRRFGPIYSRFYAAQLHALIFISSSLKSAVKHRGPEAGVGGKVGAMWTFFQGKPVEKGEGGRERKIK